MKDALENKFTMYKAVVKLFDDNAAKIAAITALTPVINSLKDKIEAIGELDNMARTASSGNADTKAADEAALIADAVPIASALFAYGASTNDDRLKALSGVTKSSLVALRDTQLITDVTNIKNLADANAASLAGYGITPAMIAALDTKLNAFNSSSGMRETGASASSAAYENLPALFKETDTLLYEQADKIMTVFKNSDPLFYSQYENTRVIKDLGHRFKKDETPVNPTDPT